MRGVWHDFVLHVRWSASADLGFVELWYDGQKVLERTVLQTLFAGTYTYLKQGLYRDSAIQPTGVVYHDGMTIGTSLADVAPQLVPPVPAPDAGTPDAGGPAADAGSAQAPDAGTPQSGGGQKAVASSGLGFPNQGCTSAGSVGALVIAAFALLRPRRRLG